VSESSLSDAWVERHLLQELGPLLSQSVFMSKVILRSPPSHRRKVKLKHCAGGKAGGKDKAQAEPGAKARLQKMFAAAPGALCLC